MKRKITICFVALILSCVHVFGQAPQGINYQGVARGLDGHPLAQKEISIRISILRQSASGEAEYDEIHEVKTNAFGLFTLVIGQGTPGGSDFSFIGWTSGKKWLQIEMDENGGRNFQLMGSQQLMSVPYALYAERSGNGYQAGQGIVISNNMISNTGDGDNDSTNELINSVELDSNNKLRITDAGGTKETDLSGLLGASQNLSNVLIEGNSAGNSTITNLGPPTGASDAATKAYVDAHVDGDASATNELQDLTQVLSQGNNAGGLKIENVGAPTLNNDAANKAYVDNLDALDGDKSATNEIQNLSQVLTESNNAGGSKITNLGAPTLSADATTKLYVDNLDATDGDKSSTNEIQNLSNSTSGTNRTINISGGTGTTIDVADNDNSPTNEIQNLSEVLGQNNSAGGTTIINLGAPSGNTDATTKQYVDNLDALDADKSATNEIQNLSNTVSGTNRTINISGGAGTTIDVADNDNSPTNEIQNLSSTVSGTSRTINISGGTGTAIDIADNDNSITNEIQDLSLAGNTLSLSGDATTVNLAAYLDNTDAQTLSYNSGSKQLSIANGNTITITETQNLSQVLTQGASAGGGRITNLGTPTAPADATTKQYVDAADALLSSRISTTYAFKATFNYTNSTSGLVSNQAMPFSISINDFDDFSVVGASSFTASEDGTYIFYIEGFHNPNGPGGTLSLLFDGTNYPITIVQPFGAIIPRFSGTFMYKLLAGQTISLIGDNIAVGAQFNGKFFGNKL